MVPLGAGELPAALRLLLAIPGSAGGATEIQVRGFLDYLATGAVQWEGYRCGPANAPRALFLALLTPGRTAIALLPSPGEHGIDPDAQHYLGRAALRRLQKRELHFVQALLVPEARAQHELLKQLGFRFLAPLIYMERDTHYPWVDPPSLHPGAWVPFRPQTYQDFAATLLATYQDSLDCPELSSLRPIDDIIAGHKASGQHDPDLWELLRLDGRNAGCLLLSRLPAARAMELVYMGVVPSFRHRGAGALLIQRALERSRQCGARRLTLAADQRNQPARRLYARFSFLPVDRRDAYLYRWSTGDVSRSPTAVP